MIGGAVLVLLKPNDCVPLKASVSKKVVAPLSSSGREIFVEICRRLSALKPVSEMRPTGLRRRDQPVS